MNTKMNKTRKRTLKIGKKVLSHPRDYLWLAINGLWKTINKGIVSKGGVVVFNSIFTSRNSANKKIFKLIRSLEKESRQLLSDFELLYLHTLIAKTAKIEGSIAEVGVYKGGSAKIICEATNKHIYLFDTFEGLPKPRREDISGKVNKGDYNSSYEDVKHYLRKYKNCTICKGLFPFTSKPIHKKRFSLLHLDVDLYKSTLDCLKFFYGRMNKGGVIICHDYMTLKGVKRAVDEFFKNKPEIVVESLAGSSQCLIIKV